MSCMEMEAARIAAILGCDGGLTLHDQPKSMFPGGPLAGSIRESGDADVMGGCVLLLAAYGTGRLARREIGPNGARADLAVRRGTQGTSKAYSLLFGVPYSELL